MVAELVPASDMGFSLLGYPAIIQAWLQGRNPLTLAAYRADLEALRVFLNMPTVDKAAAYLMENGPGHANHLAGAFRAYLLEQQALAPATVNRRLAALRSLVRVAGMLGKVTWRLDVPAVRSESYRETSGPGRDVVWQIIADLNRKADPISRRNLALVRCLYDLGLRRGEAVALDVADLNLEAGTVKVKGKGRTEKTPLTLPHSTAAALSAWLAVRGSSSGPLFTALSYNARGQRLTGRGVACIMRRLGEPQGVHLRPHGIRHTAITDALDATNGDVRAVQRFSRHKSLAILSRYDDNRQDLGGEVARMIADRMAQARGEA